MLKVVIYARVSTKVQEYDRQLEELRSYADRMGYEVAQEFSEKISGARKIEERAALTDLLDYVEKHEVNKVLIYECSRLSRRAVDFLAVIERLTEQGVSVYIHQNGLETLQPDGNPNPIANLVLGILAQFNSLEKTLIRSRMSSGYNHFRSNGGKVGRKEGFRKSDEKLKEDYAGVIKGLRKGYPIRIVAKSEGVGISTVQRVKKKFVDVL
ncbi:MAG: recombinase family protein [Bacteroidales bacterium]|nr:recombinase family protein [Bacteroidales bacterium]